jgi:hypothetical protein
VSRYLASSSLEFSPPASGLSPITTPPLTDLETLQDPLQEMRNMNRGVQQNMLSEDIAKAIRQGQAIMGTDGSVRASIATYLFVISISNTKIKPNVKVADFSHPRHSIWTHIQNGPKRRPSLPTSHGSPILLPSTPTSSSPPPLLIPVDNDGVVKDAHRIINDLTPTYDLLHPNYNILQAIRSTINVLPITTFIEHVKGHHDKNK